MSTSDKDSESSKSNDACELEEKLQNMKTVDADAVSICANCGKEGGDVNNICNKCKQVTYCNAACKKKHRHKHKKDCEEHLRLAAELHDSELFKQPPPQYGDCPICFLRLPSYYMGQNYMTCCGKMICSGCAFSPVYDNQGNEVDNQKCAFCRSPAPKSSEELIERYERRIQANDSQAIHNQGYYYRVGKYGFPQDYVKALELFHRAAELGHAKAYASIGYSYDNGEGVEADKAKARYYYELSAMGGDEDARYNLGIMEEKAGDLARAVKHFLIAIRSGDDESLKEIQELYSNGHATREDYAKALQLYQAYLGEIKSRQRDEAVAADEGYRYY